MDEQHERRHRDALIQSYFNLGLSNKEILLCLANQHGIIISIRTLKRITKKCHLYRRKSDDNLVEAALFIMKDCEGSGRLHGYRWMHLKCIQNGIHISQKTVRLLQCILDPDGLKQRKKRRLVRRLYRNSGPNALWHIDGYDKLKPYGICIHGCIDGFSRQVIWMEAWKTNNDPKVIAGYFVSSVKNKHGCPERLRADAGTENIYVKQMQCLMRDAHADRYAGLRSFMYGRSTANQKIESFWGILRKEVTDFWVDLFKKLQIDNYFEGDLLDKSLIQFCFMDLIQAEIDSTISVWNSHRIRPSKKTALPSGRPALMYSIPELYGVEDCLKAVSQERVEICEAECIMKDNIPCDKDVFELCQIILNENMWDFPADPFAMCDLYIKLRNDIRNLL